jgi:hypothetical protein
MKSIYIFAIIGAFVSPAFAGLGCTHGWEQKGLICYEPCKEGYSRVPGIPTICREDNDCSELEDTPENEGGYCKGPRGAIYAKPTHSAATGQLVPT